MHYSFDPIIDEDSNILVLGSLPGPMSFDRFGIPWQLDLDTEEPME